MGILWALTGTIVTFVCVHVCQVAHRFMRDPVKILVKQEEVTLKGIRQFYVNVEKEEHKFDTLSDIYEVYMARLNVSLATHQALRLLTTVNGPFWKAWVCRHVDNFTDWGAEVGFGSAWVGRSQQSSEGGPGACPPEKIFEIQNI